jgi:transposase, IS30 family
MTNDYKQLTHDDRLIIESMLASGHGQAAVAAKLGVHRSTIFREVKRAHKDGCTRYFSILGQHVRIQGRANAGRCRLKLGLAFDTPCAHHVIASMRKGWSPQQIAGRLRLMAPFSPSPVTEVPRISHETIYSAIYAQPRGALRTELVKLLRKSHAGRLRRSRGKGRFTGIQDMTPIELRPPEVAARIVPGHWEGDLIKGARNASAVGTLVERTSRFIMLAHLDGADAASVLDSFTSRLKSIPCSLRKTLTYDQGTEMALHATLARRLRMDIFFCDPHSPWQRGTNENSNGLLREYMPKGADLRAFSQRDLTSIESILNDRPRKVLGYRTPAEVFSNILFNQIAGVALRS